MRCGRGYVMGISRREFVGAGAAAIAALGAAGCSAGATQAAAVTSAAASSAAATSGTATSDVTLQAMPEGYQANISVYVYVGLTDKDAGKQLLTAEQGMQKVREVVKQNGVGVTVIPVWGGYVGADGTFISNDTVLVIMTGSTDEAAEKLVTSLKAGLNSTAVFVERHVVASKLYA